MTAIQPCPCGQTPEYICIIAGSSTLLYVSGSCCAEWNVEFRNEFRGADALNSPECLAAALAAWNGAPRAQPAPRKCLWTEEVDADGDSHWQTGCGEAWCFIAGGPAENNAKYCPCCGAEIEIVQLKDTP